jgi:hypothetical protein
MIDFSLPLNHGLTAAKILALSKELVKLKNLKAIIEFLADRCLNNTTIKGDIESCVSSAYILLALSLALRGEDSTNLPDSHTKKAEECFLSYINDYVDVLRTVCNVCEANIEDDQIECKILP